MGGCLTKQTIIEPVITDNKPKIKIQFIDILDSPHKNKKILILNKKRPIIHIKAINKISLRKNKKHKRPPFKYYV
jgi:hypothetical protein